MNPMPTVSELYAFLDEKLPRSLSCEWDNDGLMVLAEDRPVKAVLLALDITPAVVEHAIKIGADLILSHHPLIFRGIRHIDGKDTTARKVSRLLRCGISAMSFHTRLDMAEAGINDILAKKFALSQISHFGPSGEEAGRIGTLADPLSLSDFCSLVKNVLGAPTVSASDSGRMIRRVAVLGGAGKDYLESALNAKADVLLTGEVPYNAMLESAENGLSVVAAGHDYTEALFAEFFTETLGNAFPDITLAHFPVGHEILHF